MSANRETKVVGSATTRITFSVISKDGADYAIPDRATYYERAAAVLAAIMQMGGVGLWGERPRSSRKKSAQVETN